MPQQVSNLQSINGLCVPKQSSACSPTTGTREPVVNHFCCLQRRGSSRVSKVVKEKFTSLGKGPTVSFWICSSGLHFQSESLSKYAWGAVEVQCIEVAVQVKEKIYGNFQCQYEVTPHQGRVPAAPPHHPSVLAHPCNPTPGQFQKQIRHGSLTNEEAHRSRLVHSQEHLVAFPRVALQAQAQTKS